MRQKILVIDDSPAIVALIRARLNDEAVEIHGADDGTRGLEMAHTLLPDLILLDVDMPAPDGFEVCRRLKNDLATMHVPVIFLSATSATQEKVRGLELGAHDYVTKPFDPSELRARVRAALRLKFLMDLLSRKAQIDALTGLWNRRHLDECLEEHTSLARRHGSALSCLMIDLDHFKVMNDRYGHSFGDQVLQTAAGRIAETVRAEDSVFRYGGEEFAVLAPSTSLEGAEQLADRIRAAIAGVSLSQHGQIVPVTCSIGVATFDPTATLGLLETADLALYAAKRDGRNRVCVHHSAQPI